MKNVSIYTVMYPNDPLEFYNVEEVGMIDDNSVMLGVQEVGEPSPTFMIPIDNVLYVQVDTSAEGQSLN